MSSKMKILFFLLLGYSYLSYSSIPPLQRAVGAFPLLVNFQKTGGAATSITAVAISYYTVNNNCTGAGASHNWGLGSPWNLVTRPNFGVTQAGAGFGAPSSSTFPSIRIVLFSNTGGTSANCIAQNVVCTQNVSCTTTPTPTVQFTLN